MNELVAYRAERHARMARLVGEERGIGQSRNRVGLENRRSVLSHDEIRTREPFASKGFVRGHRIFLGAMVVFRRNRSWDTVNERWVDVLHIKIVELRTLLGEDFDDGQGARGIAQHTDRNLGAHKPLFHQGLLVALKRGLNSDSSFT